MIQHVKTIAHALFLTTIGSLLVRKTATVAVAGVVLGLTGHVPAFAVSERFAAFSFQCIGAPGGPASQFRGTATLERYKIVSGRVVIDKRGYKDINMDCTPGVNGGLQQNILPTFLDTDGRVIALDGKVYTRATTSGLAVIHEFHVGNNFFQGTFMAMPERNATNNGEVHLLISISNPSFE